jgi:hypothetical protein
LIAPGTVLESVGMLALLALSCNPNSVHFEYVVVPVSLYSSLRLRLLDSQDYGQVDAGMRFGDLHGDA